MEPKYIPILYQQDMVLACLDGTKTQTRRIKGLEKINENPEKYRYNRPTNNLDTVGFGYHIFLDHEINTGAYFIKCPYGSVGDILWVRENFYTASNWDHWKPSGLQLVKVEVFYQADLPNYKITRPLSRGKIRPNIFLPFYYARIFLEVISVSIERLKDINTWAAESEGVAKRLVDGFEEYRDYLSLGQDEFDVWGETYYSSPTPSFYSLWKKINGEDSFESNPWVWVIKFERIDKPDNLIK